MKLMRWGFAAFVPMAVTFGAGAVTVGDTVTCTSEGAFRCSTSMTGLIPENRGLAGPTGPIVNATVGSGPEYRIGFGADWSDASQAGQPYLSADFSNGLLKIGALQPGSFASTILNFTNTTAAFSSFLVQSANSFTFTSGANNFADRTSLIGGVLRIDFRGVSTSSDALLTLQVTSVPEPGTIALMLAGLGVIGFLARRRGVIGGQPPALAA